MNVRSLYLQIFFRMPRPRKTRLISAPPLMAGFKPYGMKLCGKKKLILTLEEYTCINYILYKGISQEETGLLMQVSRPTVTRIYNSALQKIARAMAEGCTMEICGGKIRFEHEWYRCKKCKKLIRGEDEHVPCAGCCEFGTDELERIS